jgi:hypothetical protein
MTRRCLKCGEVRGPSLCGMRREYISLRDILADMMLLQKNYSTGETPAGHPRAHSGPFPNGHRRVLDSEAWSRMDEINSVVTIYPDKHLNITKNV